MELKVDGSGDSGIDEKVGEGGLAATLLSYALNPIVKIKAQHPIPRLTVGSANPIATNETSNNIGGISI